ncbi:MAG: hypothetical protein AABZ94_05340 [Candidatus Eisenbacteria bacterium]
MRATTTIVISMIALAASGCGGGSSAPTAPGIGTPAGGTGTTTLLVQASVEGRDLSPGVFETVFTASVYDTLNLPASGATVSVTLPSGLAVVLAEDIGTPGTYRHTRSSYLPGTYTLSATWGTDAISGVRVVGPTVHTITSPAANATIAADQPITVTWNRTSPAQEAKVETRNYESLAETDDMASSIPSSGNPASLDQRVRVKRINKTTITAGLPGSRLEAVLRTTVEPITAQ